MKFYYCVECQKAHWEFQPIFNEHIYKQSKQGILYGTCEGIAITKTNKPSVEILSFDPNKKGFEFEIKYKNGNTDRKGANSIFIP